MLGAMLVGVRMLVLGVIGVFGVSMLVVVVLGTSGAFVVSLAVRVGVRVLVLGVVRVLGVVVLVVGVLRSVLTHQGGSSILILGNVALMRSLVSLYTHARTYG